MVLATAVLHRLHRLIAQGADASKGAGDRDPPVAGRVELGLRDASFLGHRAQFPHDRGLARDPHPPVSCLRDDTTHRVREGLGVGHPGLPMHPRHPGQIGLFLGGSVDQDDRVQRRWVVVGLDVSADGGQCRLVACEQPPFRPDRGNGRHLRSGQVQDVARLRVTRPVPPDAVAVYDEVQIEFAGDGIESAHRVRAGDGCGLARPVQVAVVLLGQDRLGFALLGQEHLHVVVGALGSERGDVEFSGAECAELVATDGDPAHPRGYLGGADDPELTQDDGEVEPLGRRGHRHTLGPFQNWDRSS
ncbi:hypothetical protein RHCRD62_10449 [Rhodococcus sp. RD6.2]|nr:hypothetical protein RHCRD62_10449 [Rhodococcus sp. RD6.2]